jgi:hypothetical protein
MSRFSSRLTTAILTGGTSVSHVLTAGMMCSTLIVRFSWLERCPVGLRKVIDGTQDASQRLL